MARRRIVHPVMAVALAGVLLLAGLSCVAQTDDLDEETEQEIADLRADAEKGDPNAQFQLGLLYQEGDLLPQSDERAFIWVKKAAEHGVIQAQINLAIIYRSGSGVPMDNVMAYVWFDVAANMGSDKGSRLRKDVSTSMTDDEIGIARQKARQIMAVHKFRYAVTASPSILESATAEHPAH